MASVLSRDSQGEPSKESSIIWMINTDPVLAGTKIIAEAWDAAGLYQVGEFAGDRFAEWNGPYRDEIRRFMQNFSRFELVDVFERILLFSLLKE